MDFSTAPAPEIAEKVRMLNNRYRHHGATSVLELALKDHDVGDLAMVSSFGAESVALLHLVSVIDNTVPVLFIDHKTGALMGSLGAREGFLDRHLPQKGQKSLTGRKS